MGASGQHSLMVSIILQVDNFMQYCEYADIVIAYKIRYVDSPAIIYYSRDQLHCHIFSVV